VVGSLLELLAARENAVAEGVGVLREQIAVLTGRLVVAEEALSRLRITSETIGEVPAGADVPLEVTADVAEAVIAGAVVAVGPSAPVVLVPFVGDGVDASALPLVYRDIVEVLDDAGEPLRAGQVCAALGLGTEPRHREGMRGKLRRLVERGWCVVDADGLFALAPGVCGRID
jgi:hypothetical protein